MFELHILLKTEMKFKSRVNLDGHFIAYMETHSTDVYAIFNKYYLDTYLVYWQSNN